MPSGLESDTKTWGGGGHNHELDVILDAGLELEHCRIEGVVFEQDGFHGQP